MTLTAILLDISAWWAYMSAPLKMYWTIAIPATILLLFLLVAAFIGSGSEAEGDADAAVDSDGGIGFQFFTLKNAAGFFAVFAWTGIAALNNDYSTFVSILMATGAGLLMMTAMAGLFYAITRLAENGTLDLRNGIGRQGEVYLFIPGKRQGYGKVQINIQGALRELQALTDDDDIRTGAIVKVVDVIDEHILLVSKV